MVASSLQQGTRTAISGPSGTEAVSVHELSRTGVILLFRGKEEQRRVTMMLSFSEGASFGVMNTNERKQQNQR
jgi:hypothetical protein